jgi:hypothetical protein
MAQGLLAGGGVTAFFSEPIVGMDLTETFDKDYALLALKVKSAPESCLVVDNDPQALERAHGIGMHTLLVQSEDDLAMVDTLVNQPSM